MNNEQKQKRNAFTASQESIILSFQLSDEELTQINISRRTNMFYATIHKSTTNLIKQKIIEFKKIEGGRKKPIKLTEKGVQIWKAMNVIKKLNR
jgi:predicted transcriptional regulator